MRRLPLLALLWLLSAALPAAASGFGVGGPFALTTHEGGRLASEDLRGRPWVLFFGFAHCPDVCPTTLFELTGALAALGPEGEEVTALFVTVDPERDTQELLAAYMDAFDNRITALRGTTQETATVARAFRATYRKVPLEGGSYTMDHTAIIYLMDRDGNLFDRIDYLEDFDTQVEKLRRLLASG